MAMMSLAAPLPSPISPISRAASASVMPSNAGVARNARASPAARAKRPAPTDTLPSPTGIGTARATQSAGSVSGSPGAAISAATVWLAAATLDGTVTPARSVA